MLEEALGMTPADKAIFDTFIASRHPSGTPQKDELETPESKEEIGTSIFPIDEKGNPFMWNFQMKGAFKEKCGFLRMADKSLSKDLSAFKKRIDGLIFIQPRKIMLKIPEGAKMDYCQRSLRADTPQGPRVTVAKSLTVPPGTTFEFEIESLAKLMWPYIKEWLDYGIKHGLFQWRNSGKGIFSWEVISKTDEEDMTYIPPKPKSKDKKKEVVEAEVE
jgi:hypothetical protein